MKKKLLDVVIVGAGASGLAAARALHEAGVPFKILEARERLGGRIFTDHDDVWNFPIELGAEFIHGHPQVTLDLIQSRHLLVYEGPDGHTNIDGNERPVPDFWEMLESVLRRIPKGGPDMSFDRFLKKDAGGPPEPKKLTASFVEGFHAADLKKISAHYLRETVAGDEGGAYKISRFAEGYDALIRALISDFPKRSDWFSPGAVVNKIKWEPGKVSVEYTEKKVRRALSARCCLITVPLGVLKGAAGGKNRLEFSPGLDGKRQALSKLEMGAVVKIVLRFKTSFWEEKIPDLNFSHFPRGRFSTWWTQSPLRLPMLTAWAGGPAALSLAALSEPRMTNAALDELAVGLKIPRRRINSEFEKAYFHDWQRDPFSAGAYSYVGVDGGSARRELARPVARCLFFAGEATHDSGETGTVDGAMESGHRAAREILGALRGTARGALT